MKPATRILSKSQLLSFRQCAKRLWLELHRPAAWQDSFTVLASQTIVPRVGDVARHIYDPRQRGQVIDPQVEGVDAAIARTRQLLQSARPVFEAGFRAEDALAFADVMLPMQRGGWRMVEVKSSTEVKDHHRDGVAIQAFLARACGVPLRAIALAHIDSGWTYPGGGDYGGLLREEDLTEEAVARGDEVRSWIGKAQTVASRRSMPRIATGEQCGTPYECGFLDYCSRGEPQAEHPVHWLPRRGKKLKAAMGEHGIVEMRDVPDEWLNDIQRRVKTATVSGRAYFDQAAAAHSLAAHRLPAYFLDFETISFAVPIWRGTRPYQQIPFQFSLHRLGRTGRVAHQPFLDLSGGNPSLNFARALVDACGERGPIFVYNAGFESGRIKELAARHRSLAPALRALQGRIVDLLPVAREHYYHPAQRGSWSIKAVLPALCPDLSYDRLDGVRDGAAAQQAYLEAIAATCPARKEEIRRQLLAYCELDTWAMVRLWSAFTGRPAPHS